MKIAFCTTCCNRLHQLRQVFDRNAAMIERDPDTEWIILDFGSTDGLADFVKSKLQVASCRITFAVERSGRDWHASVAKNIAHRLSEADILVNLDADNLIHDAIEVLRDRAFAGADVLHLWSGTIGDGTCGRIAVRREVFHALGGYDEDFCPMGYQDFDLVHRAAAAGFAVMRRASRPDVAIRNTKLESVAHCGRPGMTWEDFNAQNRAQSFTNIAEGRYVANGLGGWAEFRVDKTTGARGASPANAPGALPKPAATAGASVLGLLRFFRKRTPPPKRRSHVLVAWELGRGLGHLNRLVPIAQALEERGHRVTFALRGNIDAAMVAEALPHVPIVPAPVYRRTGPPDAEAVRLAYNYADILHRCGYESEATLQPLIAAWRSLFAHTKADLVVCDHSPTAVLAAAGRIPVLHVGSGFANPPAGKPLLPLHSPSQAGAAKREAAVLQAIAACAGAAGVREISQVSDLFVSAETFACCLPELDPYRSVRDPAALGPLAHPPPRNPAKGEGFIFAYLAADDARVLPLLEKLAAARLRCSAFVRQASEEWFMKLDGSSVRLFEHPQRMAETMGAASAVLHHGGLATTECALAIGRPQFILPRYLEQGLTAAAVESLHCGRMIAHADPVRTIERGLRDQDLASHTRDAAQEIAARPANDVLGAIVAAGERHLQNR